MHHEHKFHRNYPDFRHDTSLNHDMMTYAILLGGEIKSQERLHRQLRNARFIAADSGMKHAEKLGATVDLWVGDFDSTNQLLDDRYPYTKQRVYPVDKDATDGELALNEALRCGAQKIIMVSGFGGSSDHAFSHLTQMLALADRGIAIHITSGLEEAWPLLPGHIRINTPCGTRISIIGFNDLGMLSLSNVRWPLTQCDVPFGSTLTMSNEALGDVEIHLHAGRGIIMLTLPQDTPLESK